MLIHAVIIYCQLTLSYRPVHQLISPIFLLPPSPAPSPFSPVFSLIASPTRFSLHLTPSRSSLQCHTCKLQPSLFYYRLSLSRPPSLSLVPPSPLLPQVLCLRDEWMELLLHKQGEEFIFSCC